MQKIAILKVANKKVRLKRPNWDFRYSTDREKATARVKKVVHFVLKTRLWLIAYES